jgi:hypothetical protein
VIHVPSDVVVLAMDVHKKSISTAVLEPGVTSVAMDRIGTDDESVRRLVARFADPRVRPVMSWLGGGGWLGCDAR